MASEPEEDLTPTPGQVDSMACVLEGRHGNWAAEVAEFFATYHSIGGDVGRCWAWACVADTIRKREQSRAREL